MDVKLVMFKGNGSRKDFPITNPTTTIGRGEQCDLRVPLPSVSRKQCELRLAGQQFKVKDMGSSNGTYVNNKRVQESVLKAGDRIVVGPIVFTVQIDGMPEEIRPIKTRGQKMAEQGVKEVEEVVNLDADVSADGADSSDTGELINLEEPAENAEDFDPIAALEAMAKESEKKK